MDREMPSRDCEQLAHASFEAALPGLLVNFGATTSAHFPEAKVIDQAASIGIDDCAPSILGLWEESQEECCTA